ncbi:acyl-CoA dehydrogenase family protein [Niveispirillum sp. KHB5.9]|uniref:acyl-CoA dehydrogenase family protein n=1 Tax=Niveispirillum sp. KHB5.9 TaxID=3400269 RepID=UPI003A88FE9A
MTAADIKHPIPNDPVTIMRLLAAATPHNPAPGFLKSAAAGLFRWDLMLPFPEQDPADAALGDAMVKEQAAFLQAHFDPTRIDARGKLPPDYVELYRRAGWQKLMLDKQYGGDGLSPLNMARMVEVTASWCTAVAMSVSVNNYLGSPSYLDYMPDAGERQKVARMVADGAISGLSAVEYQGASNPIFQTTAIPSKDGRHYVINGRKCYIGNGPLADLLVVPCTTFAQGTTGEIGITVFIIDTRQRGFRVASPQTYMGLKGLANAVLEFKNYKVPVGRMVGTPGQGLTVIMEIQQPNRMFINAITLAASKLSLTWARGFSDRSYMEQPLSSYQATQATIADAAAKVFAQESVLRWLTLSQVAGNLDLWTEWTAMKPWCSDTAWSVIDATMSLIAGRGYETATSLARRGLPPYPVERFYRDMRVMRIFGTTNALMELNVGNSSLVAAAGGDPVPPQQPVPPTTNLSPANRAHLVAAAALTTQIAQSTRALITRSGGIQGALAQQPALIAIGRALILLWTQTVTLARVETEAVASNPQAPQLQELADIFCRDAAARAADALVGAAAWQADASASVSAQVMAGSLDWLLGDVITRVPPA